MDMKIIWIRNLCQYGKFYEYNNLARYDKFY